VSDVVITGTGVISALSHDVPAFWSGLCAGEVATHEAPWSSPGHFAWWAGIRDFDPGRWAAPAGLDEPDPRRTGVYVGTSMGGTGALLKAQHQLETAGPDAVDRKTMIKIWPNMAAAQLAMRYRLHGPSLTFCTACASSLDAIGAAADLIRAGRADVVIAGGTEGGYGRPDGSPDGGFVPAVFYSHAGYGLTGGTRDRLRASMPFDVDRSGIVVGEGCAMVVLESRAHAAARGAAVLGTVEGYGSLADVDAIVAHGTSTPKGDTAEIRAINQVYAGVQVAVTSIKGNLGHPSGAAGAQAVVAALCALRDRKLPPTAGTSRVDPEARFEVVTAVPTTIRSGHVQVNAFGFGGQNASLVLGAA
jgi:3-oxoacyl-[acyl-carrier-protein] synthase II